MTRLKLLFITRDFSKNVDPLDFYMQEGLAKQTHLMHWGGEGNIHEILKQFPEQPDFILLNDLKKEYCPTITGLATLEIPFGILMHDLHWRPDERKKFIHHNRVCHIFSHYRDKFYDEYPEFVDRMHWWPHFMNPEIFKDYGLAKDIDWLLMGANDPFWVYPLRKKILKTMEGRQGFVYHPHPGYRNFDAEELKNVYVGEKYAREINRSKMFFTCDSIFHYPVIKYFEVPACKTLLMAPTSQELQDLGFLPGVHFVDIDEDNFLEKAEYYLTHEQERQAITEAGFQMVHSRHTVDIRIKELVQLVEEIVRNHQP